MNPITLLMSYGRALMMGREDLIKILENSPKLGCAMVSGEWNSPDRKIVNPNARIFITGSGGGDSGDIDDISMRKDFIPDPEDPGAWEIDEEKGPAIVLDSHIDPYKKMVDDKGDSMDIMKIFDLNAYDWWNNNGGYFECMINPETGESHTNFGIYHTEEENHQVTNHIDPLGFLEDLTTANAE